MAGLRKKTFIKNEQWTQKEKIIYFFAGALPILYFAILCGGAWFPGCKPGEWLTSFETFVLDQHHFIVGFTEATPKFIAAFELVWLVGYLWYITQIQHPYAGKEHGDAQWGDPDAFTKYLADHDKRNEIKVNFGNCKEPDIPVYVNTLNYWLAEGVFLSLFNYLTSNLNMLLTGPPGTGKSFRVYRPLLSSLCGSYICTDPKRELTNGAGDFLQDNGYGVFVIDCESEESMMNLSSGFNPFKYIRNESEVITVAIMLFQATTPKNAGESNPFFEGSAQELLQDILYLMFYTYADEDKDWYNFIELIECAGVKANPKTGRIDNSDPDCLYQRFLRANDKWKNGDYTNGKPQETNLKGFVDVRDIYNGAYDTSAGIIKSLTQHCSYMKLDCVKKILSKDDIDFASTFIYGRKSSISSTGKYALFLVTSESERHFDWIVSLFYYLFIKEVYHLTGTDASLRGHCVHHVTMLMDETNNVFLPEEFVDWLSTMRSRWLSAVCCFQNWHQIKHKFPENDMDKNFRANFSTQIILGGPDPDTCEEISKLFGTQTIHKQTTSLSKGGQGGYSENEDVMEKRLWSAEEIGDTGKDDPCGIHVKGTDPLHVTKVQFQNSPLLPLLTRNGMFKPKERLISQIDNQKYDLNKTRFENTPEILFGKEAQAFIQNCEAEGIKVVKLTGRDIDTLSVLNTCNEKISNKDASTKEFWKRLNELTDIAMKKRLSSQLNFDDYSESQLLTVQRLRNTGFSPQQIRSMDGLILEDYKYEEIITYFGPALSPKEIREFADRLLRSKKQQKAVA